MLELISDSILIKSNLENNVEILKLKDYIASYRSKRNFCPFSFSEASLILVSRGF